MLEKIQQIISTFSLKLKKVYGVSVCDLEVIDLGSNRYILKGAMLTRKQKESFEKEVATLGGDIELQVSVLTEGEPKLGWGYVETTPVNVWYRTLVEDQIQYLASQIIIKDEPLKLLWETDAFFCIQQIDGTIGWVRKKYIQRFPGLPAWQPAAQKAISKADFLAYLERWLGVVYLRGGLTNAGIDCSGLVQNVYRHCFNYLLPRHSMDQMNSGEEPIMSKVGDLVFFEKLQPSGKVLGHVALVVDPQNIQFLHANLVNGKVQFNTLSEMLAMGYKLLGYRTYPVEIV